MKYDVFLMLDSFIRRQESRGLCYSQEKCCRMFGVSRSGYNAWKERRKKLDAVRAAKELEEEKLKDMFREVVKKLCYVPGKRTFRTFLWRDYGVSISVKKCRRIMNEMKLIPNRPRKDAYKNRATHDHETKAPKNLVGQNFKVAPRQVILTDITYLYYGYDRSLFYLCAFKDAYTTEILGGAISRTMDVSLVKTAYDRMMRDHGSELHEPGVLIHSDQGSQYLSTTFKQLLSDDGFLQSVSRRGNSLDNSPMESFFGRMKTNVMNLIALSQDFETARELTDRYLKGIPADSRIAKDGRFLRETDLTEETLGKIKALNELAAQRGQTLAEMALAWILKDDEVCSVLIGASRPEQILDNVKIIGHCDFSEEELRKIDEICR